MTINNKKYDNTFHTLIAIIIPCFIFLIFNTYFINTHTEPVNKTCLYVGSDTCLIEVKDKKLEKVDISHVKKELLIPNTKVVYKTIQVKQQITTMHLILFFVCIVLGIIIRWPITILFIIECCVAAI